MSSDLKQKKLEWIEVGRGVASLAVMIGHLSPWPHGWRWNGQRFDFPPLGAWGVEYFFLLSGFIIFYAHGKELGEKENLVRYGWRRICRIFPTYYLVAVMALLTNQTIQNADYRVAIDLNFILRQLILLPGTGLFVGTAWTLRHEMLFYTVFAVGLWSVRAGITVFALWIVAVLINLFLIGLPPGQVHNAAGIILLHYNVDFLLGVGMAFALFRGWTERATIIAALIACVLAAPTYTSGGFDHPTLYGVLFMKAVFTALLGLAILLSVKNVPAPKLLVELGASSYALYLLHLWLGAMFYGALKRLNIFHELPLVQLVSAVVVIVIIAHLFYLKIERPILKKLYGFSIGKRVPLSSIAIR